MSVKLFSVAGMTATPATPIDDFDFNLQLDSLRAFLADRLLSYVGPLAWVLVDEAIQPIAAHAEAGRLSSPHIVALLRRLHASLPHTIDRDAVINRLRQELLSGVA